MRVWCEKDERRGSTRAASDGERRKNTRQRGEVTRIVENRFLRVRGALGTRFATDGIVGRSDGEAGRCGSVLRHTVGHGDEARVKAR